MTIDRSIHPIQAKILSVLRFKPEARFSALNVERLTTDHFSFHINQLVFQGLVKKTKRNTYELTNVGKEFANRMDAQTVSVVKQGKIVVIIICINKHRKEKQYLIQQRLRHPYFGFCGFVGGKVKWGETIFEAAKRQLYEETGLKGKLHLIGIQHKIDSLKERDVIDDKYYFIFKGMNLKGKFLENPLGGKNMWMASDKVKSLKNLLAGVDIVLQFIEKKTLTFSENAFKEDVY